MRGRRSGTADRAATLSDGALDATAFVIRTEVFQHLDLRRTEAQVLDELGRPEIVVEQPDADAARRHAGVLRRVQDGGAQHGSTSRRDCSCVPE